MEGKYKEELRDRNKRWEGRKTAGVDERIRGEDQKFFVALQHNNTTKIL